MTENKLIIDKLIEISIECGRVNEQIMNFSHELDEKGKATERSIKHYERMQEHNQRLYNQIDVLKEMLNDK